MQKKQTAIEWLEDNLNFEPHDEQDFIKNNYIWEQAKAMEKEQIEMAFSKSYLIGLEEVNYDDANKQAEQYYNETYGQI